MSIYEDILNTFKKRLIFKKMGEKFLSLSLERKYCEIIQERIEETIKEHIINNRK